MHSNGRQDCLCLRLRCNSLHQTFKWLHQTPALHAYLTSLSAADTDFAIAAAAVASMRGTEC